MQTARAGTALSRAQDAMVNTPSPRQRLPAGGGWGGSASASNGFCSFCFCSFHEGAHLTHDFPTSSFCSLRKQE